jgi:hypothetical protein
MVTPEGPKSEAEGRGGEVLGKGAASPSPPAKGFGGSSAVRSPSVFIRGGAPTAERFLTFLGSRMASHVTKIAYL